MTNSQFVDKRAMQQELFSELSDMFGREVPMYDRALLINASCNRAVCDILSEMFRGFSISDGQIATTMKKGVATQWLASVASWKQAIRAWPSL